MKFLILAVLFIAVLILLYFHITKVLIPSVKQGVEYVGEKGLKNIIQPIGKRIWEGRDSVSADKGENR